MPKRYKIKIVRGSDTFTWKLFDDAKSPPELLAETIERWDTKQQVRDAIDEMKRAQVEDHAG